MGAVQGIGAIVIISIMTSKRESYREHLRDQSADLAQRRGAASISTK